MGGNKTVCLYNYYLVEGQCLDCPPGHWGDNCSSKCEPPEYGKSCENSCEGVCNNSQCHYMYGCPVVETTPRQLSTSLPAVTSNQTSQDDFQTLDTRRSTDLLSNAYTTNLFVPPITSTDNPVPEPLNYNLLLAIIGSVIAIFLLILIVIQLFGKCKKTRKTNISTVETSDTYHQINDMDMIDERIHGRNEKNRNKYDELGNCLNSGTAYLSLKSESCELKSDDGNMEKKDADVAEVCNDTSDKVSLEMDDESYLKPLTKENQNCYVEVIDQSNMTNKGLTIEPLELPLHYGSKVTIQYDDVVEVISCKGSNIGEEVIDLLSSQSNSDTNSLSADNYLDVVHDLQLNKS